MSKIFDAYKKRVGESPDLIMEVGRAGTQVLFQGPDDRQRDEFSRLASRLIGLRTESRGAVLAFASCAPGEGSSFVSYHAANVLAHAYQMKVAWVDCNFLSPQRQLQGQEGATFSSLLQDPERLENLRTPEALTLIPGGENLMGARGLFADDRFAELVQGLSRRFDFTILDLPPILNSTDAALLAAGTDGLLMVIEQKFLKREVIEHGLHILEDKGVKTLGSVINRRTFELPKIVYDRL